MNEVEIRSVKTKVLPDGFVEFTIDTAKRIKKCRIDYGDSKHESMTIPVTANPTLIAEHKFLPGIYKVTILVFGPQPNEIAKHESMWHQA